MPADIPYDDGVLAIIQMDLPAGLALVGEIDEATYPAFVAALEQFADRGQILHLDLSGLQYCDVAGLRAMVRLTFPGEFKNPKQLVLHAVPSYMRTTLRVLGWDVLPGLCVKGA